MQDQTNEQKRILVVMQRSSNANVDPLSDQEFDASVLGFWDCA